jgi:hypothetical protein
MKKAERTRFASVAGNDISGMIFLEVGQIKPE